MKEWIKKLDDRQIRQLFEKTKIKHRVPGELDANVRFLIKRHTGNNTGKNIFFPIRYCFSFLKQQKRAAFGLVTFAAIITALFLFVNNNKKYISKTIMTNGTVSITRNNKKIKPFHNNTLLVNDRVTTGYNSTCQLVLSNAAALIAVEQKSSLLIQKLAGNLNKLSLVNLDNGIINVKVDRLPKGSLFKVTTRDCVITVKGTEFRVRTNRRNGTTVQVASGKVLVERKGTYTENKIVEADHIVSVPKVTEKPMAVRPCSVRSTVNWIDHNNSDNAFLKVTVTNGTGHISLGGNRHFFARDLGISIKPGTYTLTVKKAGYRSYKKRLTIDENRKIIKRITLQKLIDEDNEKAMKKEHEDELHKNFISLQTGTNHKYYLSRYTLTWKAAKDRCEQLGGHLVTFSNREEYSAVLNALIRTRPANNVWIGLTDEKVEGVWKWVTGEKVTFTAWDKKQPDNGKDRWSNNRYFVNQNYVEIHDWQKKLNKWNDIQNQVQNIFILEIE